MQHSTRTLLHRWYRECRPPDGTQRRRSLLARSRRDRAAKLHARLLDESAARLIRQDATLQRRNAQLADRLKALQDRVPVYARIQEDERRYGRMFVIPVTFCPDTIVRTLLLDTAEHDRRLDLEREFRYLADFASEKILATLREAAAKHLGMPGRGR